MKEIKIVQGYKPDLREESDNIYGSGATPDPVINPSGNWREYLPLPEIQNRGFETFGCVSFTELNALEALARLAFSENWNKAERFTYIASETDPLNGGNSPKKVADSIRNKGVVDEEILPFNNSIDSIDKFNSPKPLPKSLINEANKFLDSFEFRYDFLPDNPSREVLREALKRSPLLIAVDGWHFDGERFIRLNNLDNHATLLQEVRDNGELVVFDSYEPTIKILSKDFTIISAMRFYLRKKTEEEKRKELSNSLSFLESILNWLSFLLKKKEVVKENPPIIDSVPIESLPKDEPSQSENSEAIWRIDNLNKFCKAVQEYEGWW